MEPPVEQPTGGAITGGWPEELNGEYECLGELGRGGMAVVYRARERALGREVAIKVVRPRFTSDTESVQRLAREARTVAQLEHPNIVSLHAVKTLERAGGLALVMQIVPGRTLKAALARGPLSPEHAEHVLRDIARALAYAHRNGVVHRDVKPENIFLDDITGRALLSDFGVARSIEENTELTATGTAIGTPTYMSPEQIDGGHLDGRSDLYSLGMVGWEMLTGQRPWAGESLYSVIYRQKHDPLPPLDALRPDVPPRLQFLIEGLMYKNPDRRWASSARFVALLSNDAVLEGFREWQSASKRRRRNGTSRPARPAPAASGAGPAQSTVRFRRGDTPIGGTTTAGPDAAGVADETQRLPTTPWQGASVIDYAALTRGGDPPPRRRRGLAVAAGMAVVAAVVAAVTILRPAGPGLDARPDSLRLADAAGVEVPVVRPLDSVTSAGTAAVDSLAGADSSTITAPAPTAPAPVAAATSSPATRPPADTASPSGLPRVASPAASSTAAPGLRPGTPTRGDTGGATPVRAPATTIPAPPPDVPDPVKPSAPPLSFPAERAGIAAGGRHSCMIDDGGHVRCWGNNERGQLGDGGFETRPSPAPVLGDLAFSALAAGAWHTCALNRDGDVFCWGNNDDGQLGDGTTAARAAPVHVSGAAAFRSIRGGSAHTCGLTRNATVACWGGNGHGQLGDGSRVVRTAPVTVSLGGPAAAIAVGFAHSCALTVDGTAYCWGQNDGGQLGDGTTTERATPTAVATPERFVSIAAGTAHTCAVTAAGEAFCWGRNNYGQLGLGSTGPGANTPQHVESAIALLTVTAGNVHTCARSRDGRGWCWGRNSAGQLGDGTTTDRNRPVPIRGGTAFQAISANGAHTCGLTPSGDGFCWGYNVDGQLGEGDRENASVPSKVMSVGR